MDVRQYLAEIAHVEPFEAARAFHEMICLGFGDAVSVNTYIAAVDNLSVLRDRHVDAGAAFGVDEF